MGILIRAALAVAPSQHRRVSPVRRGAAGALVNRVYDQVVRDFGVLAPPVSMHSPAPGPLAASWVVLRETLVAAGQLDRATKEAVAAAVSLGNSCPYCVEVHSATMHGLDGGADAMALAEDRVDAIADPRLREIVDWAQASGNRVLARRRPLPVPAEHAAELIGVAVTFQYFNRMVNVLLSESPFPPAMPAGARGGARRMFGRLMRSSASRSHEPGASLDLLPAARLPDDLRWAAGNPAIAQAFARAAAAVEAAGRRSVRKPVRDLLLAQLAGWDGRPKGLSRAWVDRAVDKGASSLGRADRAAARLALLTAMAAYQVDQAAVDDFRGQADDRVLVELTSWASLCAARRVGGWLWEQATLQFDAAQENPAA